MYIMYIDESGDTVPISQKGKNFLILTGCIMHEKDKFNIDIKFFPEASKKGLRYFS